MIRVLIVEDEMNIAKETQSYFTHYFNKNNITNTITIYNDCSAIIDSEFTDWDIIALDVQLPSVNGIELAKKIREKNKKVVLVFITQHDKYVIDSYKVHAFDYIAKPLHQNKIDAFMEDLLRYGYFKEIQEKKYEFITTNGNVNIAESDILYFEYVDRSKEYGSRVVKMITKNRTYIIRDKISSIYSTLNTHVFVVPHKSFIINFENVKMFKSKEIIMINNDVIPLSQKKVKQIKVLFNHFISSDFEV